MFLGILGWHGGESATTGGENIGCSVSSRIS